MKKLLSISIFILSIIVVITGCGKTSAVDFPEDNQKINVVTSFYTIYDFASKIGGDKINIINLVSSNSEPHDFEPKSRDITKLKKAKVFIYNGAGMEGWAEKIISSAENKDLIVVEASKEVKLLDGDDIHKDAKEKNELHNDPHVWLNPQNAIIEMAAIKDALVKADSKNKDYYEKNFENYKSQLNDLDKEFKSTVSSFKKKDIVVAHAAFGYMCNAYSLKQVAIEGLSAESEPTAARMAEISDFAKSHDVKVIFFEELVSPKVAKAIAKEVGAQVEMLNPLEGLSEENSKQGKEYISIMRDNLESLKKALN